MSSSDPDSVTVTDAGVTAQKSLNEEDFQTLAVVFEVTSERDNAATVTISDVVPEGIPMDDIGFHPQYGAESWTAGSGRVTFERELSPGETYTTIYGVREYDDELRAEFLSDPDIEVSAATESALTDEAGFDASPEDREAEADDLEEIVSAERSEAVRDLIIGETEGLTEPVSTSGEVAEAQGGMTPSIDERSQTLDEPLRDAVDDTPSDSTAPLDESPEDVEAPAPIDESPDEGIAEPMAEMETDEVELGGEPEMQSVDDDEEEPELRVPVTGGVTRVLIKELRGGNVSEADRQDLRDALLGDEQEASEQETPGNLEARIQHLQNAVSDLEAYTNALDAFLDESGTPYQVVDDVREDLEENIEEVETDVESVLDNVDEIRDNIAHIEDQIESAGTELREKTDELDDRLEARGADIDTLETDQEAMRSDIDRVEADIDEVRTDVRDLGSLRSDVSSLERTVESIEGDIEELQAFRDRLSTVFSAQTGGGSGEMTMSSDDDASDTEDLDE